MRCRTVGTVKKSMETRQDTWFARNARQVGDAGFGRFTMYRSTVDFATSMPSIFSSGRILGLPQVTFSSDMRRMRSWISLATGGRPGPRFELNFVQNSRNSRRRHAITVAGFTTTSACFQPDQSLESQHQKSRSRMRRRGRRAERW